VEKVEAKEDDKPISLKKLLKQRYDSKEKEPEKPAFKQTTGTTIINNIFVNSRV
jgi:hypothetical protein